MRKAARSIDKATLFAALADRTRLRLLNLLGDSEVCVCYLVEVIGAPQPTVSRHLAYLRRAGIVASRREGTWVHYRIVRPEEPGAARVLEDVLTWLGEDAEMSRDRRTFTSYCCAPRLPVQLQTAPRPTRLAD